VWEDDEQRKEREIAEGGCERSEACEEDGGFAAKDIFLLPGAAYFIIKRLRPQARVEGNRPKGGS